MEQSLNFSIQNLLYQKKDGNICGAMSPLLFAKEIAAQQQVKFNRLARVWFEDERIHQHREDGGYTGHDTLIIGTQYENDLWLSLWVDSGTGGIPVAMCYKSDRQTVCTPIYFKKSFAAKLNAEQIGKIFNHIFSNPETIAIEKE
ncbi:MAG: hypothetical protein H3C48_11255 [Chitinophagaceae bacterium]|nr:hypothetical protein [Chitinophagaceae bacterium]